MFSWTVTKAGGPKRAHHASVAVRNQLYSFGGYCDGATYNIKDRMDIHVFNTMSLCWKKLPPPGRGDGHLEVPSMRFSHTAVLLEDTVYIWGGDCEGEYDNVLYAFDVDAHIWLKPSRVSGTVPEGRSDHSACVLGKVMFIHGGNNQLTGWINTTYKLDTIAMVWTLINTRGTPPPACSRHSATVIGTKMFVVGVGNLRCYTTTIRVFDTETDLWLDTHPAKLFPDKHLVHSAFTYNGELYIFGGKRLHQTFRDLWKFSLETFSWKKVVPNGKYPGLMDTMCCCMVGDHVILFGGYYKRYKRSRILILYDELYVLDLSPSLKTLCKLAVIQYDLDQSEVELPHNIRWELVAMTSSTNSVLTANKITKRRKTENIESTKPDAVASM